MSSEKTIINATPLIDRLELTTGVSAKTGNAYTVGAVYLKSPISDTPIRIGLDYIDPNTRELLKMAVDKFNVDEKADFAADVK